MADKVLVTKLNEVHDRIVCEPSIAMELSERFTFFVPGYKFMPAFKARFWDGKIRLFNMHTKLLYCGLSEEVRKFCEERGYDFVDQTEPSEEFSIHEAKEFIANIGLPKHIEVRDYQIEAFAHAVRERRALLLSPTASGKSLMIYLITRYLAGKTLIIVPTINLVHQTAEMFAGYGYKDEVHTIFAGQAKDTDHDITITTWQSVYKQPAGWLNRFDVIFGDEAHGAKAKAMVSLMEKTTDVPYKFGFTGTLDDMQTNIMVITGLFGPVRKIISTSELMEQGHIAGLRIKAILLDYPDEIKKIAAAYKYQDEVDYIVRNRARNRFIKNLALSLKGNTLILFQFVEKHGKVLHELFKGCGRNVYYASGETPGDVRNEIRRIIAKEKNCIFIASSGTFSTGADIPQIENIIFASPSKSKIRVLQSIGRGLRNAAGKFYCTLYDIADDLSWKKHQNFTLKHFILRVKLYASEKFDYKLYRVKTKA